MKSKTKRLFITGIAATAIFSSFAIQEVRVKAKQFLSLFRVDQVEMVKLTQKDIKEIENWVRENQEGTLSLKGIGELEISGTEEPQYYETHELAKEAGYLVPNVEQFEVEGVRVTPASTIIFTLNVEKANQLLTQLGSEYQFDALLDGHTFTITTYETIKTDYRKNEKRISYMQTKSPEVQVPEGVSIEELRNTLLSLPFLPEHVKEQLAGIHSIESTLPVPIVETEGSKVTEVQVGNRKGAIVEREDGVSAIWQDNGYIHVLISESKMERNELIQLMNLEWN